MEETFWITWSVTLQALIRSYRIPTTQEERKWVWYPRWQMTMVELPRRVERRMLCWTIKRPRPYESSITPGELASVSSRYLELSWRVPRDYSGFLSISLVYTYFLGKKGEKIWAREQMERDLCINARMGDRSQPFPWNRASGNTSITRRKHKPWWHFTKRTIPNCREPSSRPVMKLWKPFCSTG